MSDQETELKPTIRQGDILSPNPDDCDQSLAFEIDARLDDIKERMKASPMLRELFKVERVWTRFDQNRQLDYLAALAATGRKGDSAAFAGVNMSTIQRHADDDEVFAQLQEQALEMHRDKIRRAIEEEGIDGALQPIILRDGDGAETIEGWRRVRNPRILELAAKLKLPEYRERLEVTGQVDVQIGVLAIPASSMNAEEWDKHHSGRKMVDNLADQGTVDE